MTSRPFQSRTLTWFNRQRLRWGDRWRQGWRSAQVAVQWGLQVLLYPLYVAIQSSRVLLQAGRAQASGGSFGLSDSTQAERTPPRQDLVTFFFDQFQPQTLWHPQVTATQALPQLRGIASLRVAADRGRVGALVWVDDRNQLWTIAPRHAQRLTFDIFTLVANHALGQFSPVSPKAPHPKSLSPVGKGTLRLPAAVTHPLKLLTDRPQAWPMIRWGRRLINWMEAGPLAQRVNLFAEAQWQSCELPVLPFPSPLPPQWPDRWQQFWQQQGGEWLTFIDYHLALWEAPSPPASDPLAPITHSRGGSPQAIAVPRSFAPMLSPLRATAVRQNYPPVQSQPAQSRSDQSLDSHLAPALVTGGSDSPLLEEGSAPLASHSPAYLWVSRPVTFDNEQGEKLVPPVSPLTPLAGGQARVKNREEKTLISTLTPTVKPLDEGRSFTADPETATIEIPGQALGYEKHPLEYLLHWLDRCLTWLEQGIKRLLTRFS